MLNSTEHEISTAHRKLKFSEIKKYIAIIISDVEFIMLINVKMTTIANINIDATHYFFYNSSGSNALFTRL